MSSWSQRARLCPSLPAAAHATFSEALTLWSLCPDAWVAWGRFCDAQYVSRGQGSWLEQAGACYTQVGGHESNQRCKVTVRGQQLLVLMPRLLLPPHAPIRPSRAQSWPGGSVPGASPAAAADVSHALLLLLVPPPLQGVKLSGLEARSLVPRLLQLLMLDANGPDAIGRTLIAQSADMPTWVWLPWVPQLMMSLQRPEVGGGPAVTAASRAVTAACRAL